MEPKEEKKLIDLAEGYSEEALKYERQAEIHRRKSEECVINMHRALAASAALMDATEEEEEVEVSEDN